MRRSLYGLDHEQMCWRRNKIIELEDPVLFGRNIRRPPPKHSRCPDVTASIPPALVARARKAQCEASGLLVIGYDPAWMGSDRHSMAWRRGRRVVRWNRSRLDTVQGAGWGRPGSIATSLRRCSLMSAGLVLVVFDQISYAWASPRLYHRKR